MQFSTVVLFAASALAASSTVTEVTSATMTSCGPEVTNCPARHDNGTVSSTYSDAAAAQGSYFAAGAAALAAGALLM